MWNQQFCFHSCRIQLFRLKFTGQLKWLILFDRQTNFPSQLMASTLSSSNSWLVSCSSVHWIHLNWGRKSEKKEEEDEEGCCERKITEKEKYAMLFTYLLNIWFGERNFFPETTYILGWQVADHRRDGRCFATTTILIRLVLLLLVSVGGMSGGGVTNDGHHSESNTPTRRYLESAWINEWSYLVRWWCVCK